MKEWYQRCFGQDYLLLYKHRDFTGATKEVERMVEWLYLPNKATILDLCCGVGRHAISLAKYGYQVTGIDLSQVLLREAVAYDVSYNVNFLVGDMRSLPIKGPFDAVVNLFTSFGYFSNHTHNQQVLHEIYRVLRPGGQYIIDFLNAPYVRNHLVPFSMRDSEGIHIEERRQIKDGFVIKHIVLTDKYTNQRRHYEERVRLYMLSDFKNMLKQANLCIHAIYGGYDSSPYQASTSLRLIIVGYR